MIKMIYYMLIICAIQCITLNRLSSSNILNIIHTICGIPCQNNSTYSNNDVSLNINKFINCATIIKKRILKNTSNIQCNIEIGEHRFNLANCKYNYVWDLCGCCPYITFLGHKLNNTLCSHEGTYDMTTWVSNITAKCEDNIFSL